MKIVAVHVLRVLTLLLYATVPFAESYGGDADSVVIEYGNQVVTHAQLDRRFQIAVRLLAHRQGLSLSDQEPAAIESLRDQYLQKFARELVFLREAERRQLEVSNTQIDLALGELLVAAEEDDFGDDDLLRAVVRDEQIIELLSEAMLKEIQIPPGDVITMHHDVKDSIATPEKFCVRHVQVATLNEANDIRTQLEQGEDFGNVAIQRSIDAESASNGGDMGCFERVYSVARSAFEKAVFAAEEGQLVGPVESEFGQHILVVYRHDFPHVPTLDEAYAEIERALALEQLPARLQAFVSASDIDVYPDALRVSSE